jgi:hypothetical protein
VSFERPSKIFSAVALAGHLCLVVVGIAWWILNLGTIPAYGDTSQYFHLATTLHVDQYRTLFYPLLLRGLLGIARLLNTRIELAVYLLQTAAALLSVIYLHRALWDLSTRTERFAFLAEVAPAGRLLRSGLCLSTRADSELTLWFCIPSQIETLMAPLAEQIARLDTITGVMILL